MRVDHSATSESVRGTSARAPGGSYTSNASSVCSRLHVYAVSGSYRACARRYHTRVKESTCNARGPQRDLRIRAWHVGTCSGRLVHIERKLGVQSVACLCCFWVVPGLRAAVAHESETEYL